MNNDIMKDIIHWFEGDTIKLINQVISDDIVNPEYSAITCSNRIIRLIQIEKEIGSKYKTIEQYLSAIGYSKEDIKIFMKSRENEIKYYQGEIYKI